MPEIKRIICLANSRKLNGRCVAGIEIRNRRPVRWIRPVSAREHEELSRDERRCHDGTEPSVMDIVDVPLLCPRPHGHQQENWLLDSSQCWVKCGRVRWRDLAPLVDREEPLWINGHSTYNGLNDRIPAAEALALRTSLRLIHVDCLTLLVYSPGEEFGNPRRRLQGRFRYCGEEYWLWVTDPRYEEKYVAHPDGGYEIGESYLTVSLSEPYEGACYKLLVAIIEREKAGMA